MYSNSSLRSGFVHPCRLCAGIISTTFPTQGSGIGWEVGGGNPLCRVTELRRSCFGSTIFGWSSKARQPRQESCNTRHRIHCIVQSCQGVKRCGLFDNRDVLKHVGIETCWKLFHPVPHCSTVVPVGSNCVSRAHGIHTVRICSDLFRSVQHCQHGR